MAGERLIRLIKNASRAPQNETTDLLWGEVTSESPLVVKVDDRFELSEEFLMLSALVKETWINIPEREDDKFEHKHIIKAKTLDTTLGFSSTAPGSPVAAIPSVPAPIPPSGPPESGGSITPPLNPMAHYHNFYVETELELPKILLWRGLKEGDKVILLRVGKGQRFMILQRVEGID